MEGISLSKSLDKIPRHQIHKLVESIASAAEFLEKKQLVHRDIKPDNIIYSTISEKATLLDFGVLRPFGSNSNATDDENIKNFVGTLQYSSPEFLLRKEDDTTEGWRAVTFYQLGTVLHDLIEGRPIFENEKYPYARLVNAVQHTIPHFRATDLGELVTLAKNCLQKNPEVRLKTVSWADFRQPASSISQGLAAKNRIQSKQNAIASSDGNISNVQWEETQRKQELVHTLRELFRQWCIDQDILPPVEVITNSSSNKTNFNFDFHFRPDNAKNLKHHLFIRMYIQIIDINTESIIILGAACISDSEICSELQQTSTFYSGILDKPTIFAKCADFIFPAFEWAISEHPAIDKFNFPIVFEIGN